MTQSLYDTVSLWHNFFMPQYLFGGEYWSVYMTQSLNDTNQWRPYMTQCLCDTVPIWHSVFVPQSQYDTMHKRLYMTLPSLLCLRHIDTVSYRYCVIKNSVISTLCHKETVSLRHVTPILRNLFSQTLFGDILNLFSLLRLHVDRHVDQLSLVYFPYYFFLTRLQSFQNNLS